jgi:hypothetical protein
MGIYMGLQQTHAGQKQTNLALAAAVDAIKSNICGA